MRHGRAKAARRTLQFFRLNVGIHPPYHVLCDGCFLVAMVTQKVPLMDRLEKLLQHSQFSLYVTRSSLNELKLLKEQTKADKFHQAWQYGLDECEILEDRDIPEVDDQEQQQLQQTDLGKPALDVLGLVSSSSNKHYMVATQDETLLDLLRNMGTVPLIRLTRSVVLLENPSKASQQRASAEERTKWRSGAVNQHERALVQHVVQEKKQQEKSQASQQQQQQHRRIKHKAKGPNPLSCKKKRKEEKDNVAPKRKRRRKNKKEEA